MRIGWEGAAVVAGVIARDVRSGNSRNFFLLLRDSWVDEDADGRASFRLEVRSRRRGQSWLQRRADGPVWWFYTIEANLAWAE